MWFALVATVMFSISVVAAGRSSRLLGSHTANFWRIAVAVVLLGIWAFSVRSGFGGGAFLVFFLSGCVGFGLGDVALFQSLPRLGPRLASLMVNCLAAPFAALIEWGWMGTRLSALQVVCGTAILVGVALALAPEKQTANSPQVGMAGIVFGTLAGFGQGFGAVISRKAYAVSAASGHNVDGGSAAFQRILGGLVIVAIPFFWVQYRRWLTPQSERAARLGIAERKAARWWVLVNALSGPTIGVAFYQWALKTTPSGIVLPIVATTPLVVIPLTYRLEGDRPGVKSLVGGVVAVAGVAGLTLAS